MRVSVPLAALLGLAACGRGPDVPAMDAALLATTPAAAGGTGPSFADEPIGVEVHQGAVTDLAFLDDERIVTVSYDDYRVALWSVADGSAIAEDKHKHRLLSVVALPDGSAVLTSDAYGYLTFWPVTADAVGPAQVLNAAGPSDQIEQRLGHHARLAISPNGRVLAASSFDRLLTVWDVEARKELRRVTMERPLRGIAFAPDGRRLAVGGADNTWTLLDLAGGGGRTYVVSKVDPKSDLAGIAFSRDGSRLATGHMDSSLTLWDPAAGKELFNRFVQNSSVADVAFAPDGTLAVGAHNANLQIWDTKTFYGKKALKGVEGAALSVAFSPAGAILAAGTDKGRLLLYR